LRFVKRRGVKASTASSFLNVTWAEIKRAKRWGEKEMEFGLDGIFEIAKPDMLDESIAISVESLLKKEGLLPPGTLVVIPVPGVDYECEPIEDAKGIQDCRFSGVFDIYEESGRNVICSGFVAGKMHYNENKDEFTILDITTIIPTENVEKLKREAGKARK